MTLLQLQYFKTLARVLHYTQAAAELHIAQPSLSMALDKLGKELGVALFLGEDAHRRSARLTEAGRQRSLRQPRRAERRAADYLPPGLPDGQAAGRTVCRLGLHPAPGLSPQPPAPCRPWCWSERKSGKRTNPGRLWQQTTAGRDLFLFCFSPPRSHRPGPC